MKTLVDRWRNQTAALSHGFWALTGGQSVLFLGSHFLTIASSAFTYSMTGSAWAYALHQLVMFLPWMLFAGLAGPLVDRSDRRRTLIIASLVRCGLVLAYPLCRRLEHILMINFLMATANVFIMTARTALIPALCPRDRLLTENGLRTAVSGVIDLIGPALAGALLASIGTTTAFRLASVAFALGALWFTRLPDGQAVTSTQQALATLGEEREVKPGQHGLGRDLGAAYAFLRRDPLLLGLIVMFSAYTFGQNGTNSIFYPYVDTVLRGGPGVFGLSISLYFGSNLLAGLLLARFGQRIARLPLLLLMLPTALVWFAYSLLRTVPPVLVCGVIEGIAFAVINNLLLTQVQARAPLAMTGRVWGLVQTISSTCEVGGILAAGAAAGRFGTSFAYRWIGICGVVALVGTDFVRRRLQRSHQEPVAAGKLGQ